MQSWKGSATGRFRASRGREPPIRLPIPFARPPMNDVGLTHIALPVTDLDESADFYERYARMQIVHRRAGVLWLSDKTRPFVLVLIDSPAVLDPLRPTAHLGVGCERRDEVDRLAALARTARCLNSCPADHMQPVR